MGITRIIALEIFTNPSDLEITIGQENEKGKFSIGIFRGPGHNFKAMITSQPFAETLEDAVKAVEQILRTAHDVITKEFADPESYTSQYLNPTGEEIDQTKVLNTDLINRILDELRKNKVASTYKMFAPTN